ncbi:MAG: autotransporter domain-containing protein, partial [Phycisphaeraceae bacterium]|nr:autotransporter domain-containing protein [Phycisphaeraceae bacterium]
LRADNTPTDFAVTGRVEAKVLGDRWNDSAFTSLPGDELFLTLGAAGHYELGKTGTAAANDDLVKWTADAIFKVDGFSAYAAAFGSHMLMAAGPDINAYGFVVQGAYALAVGDYVLEPFARFDWQYIQGAAGSAGGAPPLGPLDNHEQYLTIGGNFYIRGHSAKVTIDATHAFNVQRDRSGLGFRAAPPNAWTVRAQFQLLF